jgi:hypothetical protein
MELPGKGFRDWVAMEGQGGWVARLAMSARNRSLGAFARGGRFWTLKVLGFGHDRKQSESEVNRKYTWPGRDILIIVTA